MFSLHLTLIVKLYFSAVDGVERSASSVGRLTPKKRTIRTHNIRLWTSEPTKQAHPIRRTSLGHLKPLDVA
jgi:hypothetical protein